MVATLFGYKAIKMVKDAVCEAASATPSKNLSNPTKYNYITSFFIIHSYKKHSWVFLNRISIWFYSLWFLWSYKILTTGLGYFKIFLKDC